jgi:hypothetical protein
MFKNRTLFAAATVAALTLLAPAQSTLAQTTSTTDDTQLLISQIQTDKRAIVLQALDLTDPEVKAFTPIYDQYQRDRKAIFERQTDLLNKYASNYDSMTDAAAKDILKDWLKIKDDQLSLVKSYSKKFAKVLPPTKVLRWVQVENKLESVLAVEAARIVPLAK